MSEGTNKDQDWIAAPSPADVATAKPPRARVEDAVDPEESARATMERKRDYLEGFLQKRLQLDLRILVHRDQGPVTEQEHGFSTLPRIQGIPIGQQSPRLYFFRSKRIPLRIDNCNRGFHAGQNDPPSYEITFLLSK